MVHWQANLPAPFVPDYLEDAAPSAVKISDTLRLQCRPGPRLLAGQERKNKTRREKLSPRIMMQERDEKLFLYVASHQAQTCQDPAEQHYSCTTVRDSTESSGRRDATVTVR